MRARTFGLALLAATGGACSILVDTEGLVGGVADAGAIVVEGGSDGAPDDAVAPDANAVDAADGAPARDAAADADAGAPGRFCLGLGPSPPFRFCADFDGPNEDGGPAAEWKGIDLPDGATLALDTAHTKSPPRALRATTTSDSTRVYAPGPAATSYVKADLDFFLVGPLTTGEAVCVFGLQQDTPAYSAVLIYMTDTNIYGQTIGAGVPEQFSPNAPTPALGAWHHVSFYVDQVKRTLTVTYDGAKLFDDVVNAHPWTTTDTFTISSGLPFPYQVTAADVVVDNVVVEAM
jgi:hypothetical protein